MKQMYNKGRLQGNAPRDDTKKFICYNCKEKGHFAQNCPKERVESAQNKEKQKALLVAWDDAGSEEELKTEVRSSNLCLMAQSANDTLSEVSDTELFNVVNSFEKPQCVLFIK